MESLNQHFQTTATPLSAVVGRFEAKRVLDFRAEKGMLCVISYGYIVTVVVVLLDIGASSWWHGATEETPTVELEPSHLTFVCFP